MIVISYYHWRHCQIAVSGQSCGVAIDHFLKLREGKLCVLGHQVTEDVPMSVRQQTWFAAANHCQKVAEKETIS